MTEIAQLHVISIEQDWCDGLRAIEEQYVEAELSRQRWIRIGRGLLAGRQKCPANHSFNEWIDHTGYGVIRKDERPDAMWLAVNAATVLRALSETRIGNPSRARRHVRKNLAAIYEQCEDVRPSSEDSEHGDDVQQIVETSESSTATPAAGYSPIQELSPRQVQPKSSIKPSRLHGWERADEVLAIFQHSKTKGTVSRITRVSGGRQIWELLLQAIDGGLLHSNTIEIKRLTARLVFPYGTRRTGRFCHAFDLTKTAVRNRLATDVLPLMIANKDALLARPDDTEDIFDQARLRAAAAHKTALVEERAAKAIAALPSDECEVVMFGKRMWPIIEGETIGTYDFQTLQVAIWKFTDLNCWLHRDNVGTRAINIRNSTKWDQDFISKLTTGDPQIKIRRMYSLVHQLTLLMEKYPEGECRQPLTPLVLG